MTVRRAALATVVATIAGCLVWGFWIEPASLRVQPADLALAWPYPRPLRIAVVSDLHVGSPYQSLAHLRTVVDRINETRPDLVCLLGDFVTVDVIGGNQVAPELIARELKRLNAPGGLMAVLGNHDNSFDGHRTYRALSDEGIRVLEDSAVRTVTPSGPVWIAGVSDVWTRAHDVPRALRSITDSVTPIILITHNPDIFPDVPARVMLTLAGHTHGGQVRLPLIGAPIEPSRYGQRYASGHIVEGGRHLYVTTGVGTSGIPVRFGVPPTISLLTISREAAGGGFGRSTPRTVGESR